MSRRDGALVALFVQELLECGNRDATSCDIKVVWGVANVLGSGATLELSALVLQRERVSARRRMPHHRRGSRE